MTAYEELIQKIHLGINPYADYPSAYWPPATWRAMPLK